MLVCVCDLQKLKILVRVDFHFPRHHKKIALARLENFARVEGGVEWDDNPSTSVIILPSIFVDVAMCVFVCLAQA